MSVRLGQRLQLVDFTRQVFDDGELFLAQTVQLCLSVDDGFEQTGRQGHTQRVDGKLADVHPTARLLVAGGMSSHRRREIHGKHELGMRATATGLP